MMKKENKNLLNPGQEKVFLGKPIKKTSGRIISFFVCVGLLLSVFAISELYMDSKGLSWGDLRKIILAGKEPLVENPGDGGGDDTDLQEPIPNGALQVITNNLCKGTVGAIQNETPFLLSKLTGGQIGDFEVSRGGNEPLFLVIHSRPTEAYQEENAAYYFPPIGDVTYSFDTQKNVFAVGAAFCDEMNARGLPCIQVREAPERSSLQNSRDTAERIIQEYCSRYPSIRYVIDIRRDAKMTDDGNLIRAIGGNQELAQVRMVIECDTSEDQTMETQRKLALAMQLRDSLNGEHDDLCRPILLTNKANPASAFRIDIGCSGNSVTESIQSARVIANSISNLLIGVDGG